MQLQERIVQLACFGVDYKVRPLNKTEDFNFSGSLIAIFENGQGVEYISSTKNPIMKDSIVFEDSIYRILEYEIGEKKAKEIYEENRKLNGFLIGSVFEIEKHIILDFKLDLFYECIFPSRRYLK